MISNFSFSDTTVGFLIEGTFNKKTVDNFIEAINEKLAQFETINLYIEDTGIESFSLPALVEELSFKIKHGNRFNKVALVCDRQWLKRCGDLYDFFTDSEFQNFSSEERIQAMSWIAQYP
ncbi:SpoIIAA family protein [Marixanthomonas spongiae]|uniref:STAS/SEC14 domain-containing protein n=1 Tax=Marixanthomonas spongiae TaxID=2174845 RepID=A0A2U0I7U0_9FLAO|nr:STAS/SEC14 domain-containing protein [Marixanthomonas spongiae]PVW17175.1 hypothetical protein DDV96_01265 [Marixanthomonas spongiae]